MRRLRFLLVAAMAWGLCAGAASAVDLGAFGSYWKTKDADNAFGAGVKLRLGIIEFRGSFYNDVTADVDPEELDFEVSATPLEAGLVLRFLKNAAVSPYVGGGAGYYMLDTNVGDIDDEAGYYLVGGADIGSGIVAFNVEAMYRNFEGTVVDQDDSIPELEDEVTLDLSGVAVNAGIIFRF